MKLIDIFLLSVEFMVGQANKMILVCCSLQTDNVGFLGIFFSSKGTIEAENCTNAVLKLM